MAIHSRDFLAGKKSKIELYRHVSLNNNRFNNTTHTYYCYFTIIIIANFR